jgi:hypothetical protein
MTTVINGSYPAVNSDSDASISGLTVGKGGGAVASNTALGYQAGYSNTTGTFNSFFGYQAAQNLTTGSYNTAIGINTLNGALTGTGNAALGHAAGNAITTGNYNTYLGSGASGVYGAGQLTTTGASNVGVGTGALAQNTTAFYNTAVGFQAGYSGTTATLNALFGVQAGYSLTTGSSNSIFGANGSSGAPGSQLTTGSKNSIFGAYNGNQGGLDIRTANNYIVLSDGDGNPKQVISPSGDVFINTTATFSYANGKLCVNADSSGNPAIVAGVNGTSSAYNNIVLGNSTGGVGRIQTNGSSTTYLTSSDHRLKSDVKPIENAFAVIERLNPVSYIWNIDGRIDAGFLAHEFQEVLPNYADGTKDGVDADGKPAYQAVDKSGVIPFLVKAIQELKAEVDSLKAQLGK